MSIARSAKKLVHIRRRKHKVDGGGGGGGGGGALSRREARPQRLRSR